MTVKKSSAALVVLIFFWLQTYQLCDASEDTVKALPIAVQLRSAPRPTFSAPIPHDNDEDAGIPSVFDQTLIQGRESAASPLTPMKWEATSQPFALVSMVVVPDSRSLSPPNESSLCLVGHSNDVFTPSNSTLAPPVL